MFTDVSVRIKHRLCSGNLATMPRGDLDNGFDDDLDDDAHESDDNSDVILQPGNDYGEDELERMKLGLGAMFTPIPATSRPALAAAQRFEPQPTDATPQSLFRHDRTTVNARFNGAVDTRALLIYVYGACRNNGDGDGLARGGCDSVYGPNDPRQAQVRSVRFRLEAHGPDGEA